MHVITSISLHKCTTHLQPEKYLKITIIRLKPNSSANPVALSARTDTGVFYFTWPTVHSFHKGDHMASGTQCHPMPNFRAGKTRNLRKPPQDLTQSPFCSRVMSYSCGTCDSADSLTQSSYYSGLLHADHGSTPTAALVVLYGYKLYLHYMASLGSSVAPIDVPPLGATLKDKQNGATLRLETTWTF